jgi:type III restriction enzyme
MEMDFFAHPILNSPYEYPSCHWELDDAGQPTGRKIARRREAAFVTPIPKPRKRKGGGEQREFVTGEDQNLSDDTQQYRTNETINSIRAQVDAWRRIPNSNDWGVTPETARLLQHWRAYEFSSTRPFFCQVEAAETAIWLTEVAPKTKAGRDFLVLLDKANEANPLLRRLALKLATGAGKTTVMAMLIAWQTINAVRRPTGKRFTKGFLLVTPGITIRDRLRVLLPNDPDNYYAQRELVPSDLLPELQKAKIIITNYHAFKLRERVELSKGGRQLLQGRTGSELQTLETEGQMLQRVMPELMGIKNILVVNDEAHHCYREKLEEQGEAELKGDEKKEAEQNNAAARLWISGLETVQRRLGISRVFDLSATPFFLRGSGYAEGTLFPWTMSDFSLMDAIECGIVKLPRVPVSDNVIRREEMPMYRNLWENIRDQMPRKGRAGGGEAEPERLPPPLQTALLALYGHYENTFEDWEAAGIQVPPCFILVCNNTATSKLVYEYIAGYQRTNAKGETRFVEGKLEKFRNFDDNGTPIPRPNTLLIDSAQLESGEGLDDAFRTIAKDEIDRFRREIVERTGDQTQAENLTDQDLLREVMNTVGKEGRLGANIRCVVSVSMLTEGWDANTVTHVLGVRAFGTQLLCEQVIGRALRRESYELDPVENKFKPEYADVLGIPFDFTAEPVIPERQKPRPLIHVKALRPERDEMQIRFPRVEGYRHELPEEQLTAVFTGDSRYVLTPDDVGPTKVEQSGIVGERIELSLESLKEMRSSTLLFNLTRHLLFTRFSDPVEGPKMYLFNQLKRIVREWLEGYLQCAGGTYPALLMYQQLAERACDRIFAGINAAAAPGTRIEALIDPYNPVGSTAHVSFTTSKTDRYQPLKSHINWAIVDSEWEAEFCRVADAHPLVRAWVKNHNLGFEVPYLRGGDTRRYRPDFIVLVDDGREDPVHLVVEIKGYRSEDAKDKKLTMETMWVPGVNGLGTYGRWAFAEFTQVYEIESEFGAKVGRAFDRVLRSTCKPTDKAGAV